jgi:hypothetical protein
LVFGPGGQSSFIRPDSGQLIERVEAEDAAHTAGKARTTYITVGSGSILFVIAGVVWTAYERRAGRGETRRGRPKSSREECVGGRSWVAGLVASAVDALDQPDQARYREEWAADLAELPPDWRRLRWALILRLCAPRGIRAARYHAPVAPPPHQQ